MTKIKWRLTGNSSVDFPRQHKLYSHFLILTNLIFYKNEYLKGNECLQKSLDGIFILPDKVSFMSWALLCLQPLPV